MPVRTTLTSVAIAAMILASAVVPATSKSMGGGPREGMSAGSRSPLQVGSTIKNGPPIAFAKKKSGKLNGACYRSCVKTSMGDAFRTDQFCAHSCSLD